MPLDITRLRHYAFDDVDAARYADAMPHAAFSPAPLMIIADEAFYAAIICLLLRHACLTIILAIYTAYAAARDAPLRHAFAERAFR